jgi:hypothetical protein
MSAEYCLEENTRIPMDDDARSQLAQRLSALSFKDARKEVRALDPQADMKYWRNAIWDEIHTLFTLPNAGLSVSLVEKAESKNSNRTIGGGPRGLKGKKVTYKYVEARVELLDRPAHKRGSTGPSPLKLLHAQETASGEGE